MAHCTVKDCPCIMCSFHPANNKSAGKKPPEIDGPLQAYLAQPCPTYKKFVELLPDEKAKARNMAQHWSDCVYTIAHIDDPRIPDFLKMIALAKMLTIKTHSTVRKGDLLACVRYLFERSALPDTRGVVYTEPRKRTGGG